ncbi:hypothetical protein Fcan01_22698 [Folsomia candida]|uniref:Uncharacterized protein n=1 Tax=Folsomia candida TaxID=158441 RepID=A0A226D9W4_FOLCA|nr:hypothetical protein Fcan01_22698 [Folsomia candida]
MFSSSNLVIYLILAHGFLAKTTLVLCAGQASSLTVQQLQSSVSNLQAKLNSANKEILDLKLKQVSHTSCDLVKDVSKNMLNLLTARLAVEMAAQKRVVHIAKTHPSCRITQIVTTTTTTTTSGK